MAFQQHRTVTAAARLLGPAILLAAAATLGGSAIGTPAVACAEPREWDIGSFDACRDQVTDAVGRGIIQRGSDYTNYLKYCCAKSGGDWNDETNDCQAPPAEQGTQTGPQANLPQGGVPQATLAPATPGPVAPQTPAPAG
jgi:hypothetical protein